jgi:hypothetical protein
MPNDKPFYLCWVANKNRGYEVNQGIFTTGESPFHNIPKHRHATVEEAKKEAIRLATKTGARVYVLQAVGCCDPLPPDQRPIQWVELGGTLDDLGSTLD